MYIFKTLMVLLFEEKANGQSWSLSREHVMFVPVLLNFHAVVSDQG